MIAIYILLGLVYLAIGAFFIGVYDNDFDPILTEPLFVFLWLFFWPMCFIAKQTRRIIKLPYKAGQWVAKKLAKKRRRK